MLKLENLQESLPKLDQKIREGRSRLVRRELEGLLRDRSRMARLSRPDRLQLARLCRRVGNPLAGVRILHPLVRPLIPDSPEATASEQAEYAVNLAQIGGRIEGQAILDSLLDSLNDHPSAPEALLFGAFTRFAAWDYQGALPLLRRYVELPGLGDYARCVGKVNLASALVHEENRSEALPLLNQLISDCPRQGFRLIQSNALLVLAEAAIQGRAWSEAARALVLARETTRQVSTYDALFVEKWAAILDLQRTGGRRPALARIEKVRADAWNQGHWETVRECDFHRACVTRDHPLLTRVYLGTAFPEYRRRIEATGFWKAPDGAFDWIPEHCKPSSGPAIPLFTDGLKTGQVPWRLARCLVSDFYAPFRLASLHAEVFPGRHFHPIHSPIVVHQALRRLRCWLKKQRFPMWVEEKEGAYRLGSRLPIVLPRQISGAPESAKLDRLLDIMRQEEPISRKIFRRKDVERMLGISERSAAYWLKEMLDLGWIETTGSGPKRAYRVVREIPKGQGEIIQDSQPRKLMARKTIQQEVQPGGTSRR